MCSAKAILNVILQSFVRLAFKARHNLFRYENEHLFVNLYGLDETGSMYSLTYHVPKLFRFDHSAVELQYLHQKLKVYPMTHS